MQCPPDKAHLATLTQLRGRRLKPAPGQRPCDRYWQGHAWVSLYEPTQAVAMRPPRPATPRQRAALEAGRALAGTFGCPDCRSRVLWAARRPGGLCPDCDNLQAEQAWQAEAAACWRGARLEAAAWLAAEPLFVDVETSRLDAQAEIIEIAVVDVGGAVLLHSLVRPTQPIAPEATAIHGLGDADVASAPAWPAVCAQLDALLSGHQVVAHNAGFDRGRVAADCARHQLVAPVATWSCSMELLTDVNGGRWPALDLAAELASAPTQAPAHIGSTRHRAVYDAWLCRTLVQALAGTRAQDHSEAPAQVLHSREST